MTARDLPTMDILWNGIPLSIEYEWEEASPAWEPCRNGETFTVYSVFSTDGTELTKYLTREAIASITAVARATEPDLRSAA